MAANKKKDPKAAFGRTIRIPAEELNSRGQGAEHVCRLMREVREWQAKYEGVKTRIG